MIASSTHTPNAARAPNRRCMDGIRYAMPPRQQLRVALWISALPVLAAAAALMPVQGPPAAPGSALTDPFAGVTANGKVVPGLFPIASTGVSTKPVRDAAGA